MKANELNAHWKHKGLPYQLEQYGSAPVWAICRPRPYDDNAIAVLYGDEGQVVSQAQIWLERLRGSESASVIEFIRCNESNESNAGGG